MKKKIKKKRIGAARLTWLTKDELRCLLTNAKQHNEEMWLALLVAYWHAARVSELLALTPADIRDGKLVLTRGKGSHRTTYPLIVDADPVFDERAALEKLCSTKLPFVRLFPWTREWVRQQMLTYGLPCGIDRAKLHPHSLKHSIARHLLASTGNLPCVQKYLGHRSLGSTGVYLELDDAQACSIAIDALTTKK